MLDLKRRNAIFGFLILFAMAFGVSTTVETRNTEQNREAKRAVPPANDADFAEFVKKATTKPEFLSPLVDHLGSDAQPADDRGCGVRQGPRDHVCQQSHLPMADLRRARDGV